jgi:hypothetical protein
MVLVILVVQLKLKSRPAGINPSFGALGATWQNSLIAIPSEEKRNKIG